MTADESAGLRKLLGALADQLEGAPGRADAQARAAEPIATRGAYEAGVLGSACRQGAHGIRTAIKTYLGEPCG